MANMWEVDRTLDLNTVRTVVRSQFREFASVEPIFLTTGWDHDVYRFGDVVFRFPRRAQVVPRLQAEVSLLKDIGGLLPVRVPQYSHFGHPCAEFPHPFFGCMLVDGEPCPDDASPASHVTSTLQAFIEALHGIPCDRAHNHGVLRGSHACDPSTFHTLASEALGHALAAIPERFQDKVLGHVSRPEPAPAASSMHSLLHNDLRPEHILVSSCCVPAMGIIDWTDAILGDPALDYLWIWLCWGDALLIEVFPQLGEEQSRALLDRIRYMGLCKAIVEISYGLQTKTPEKIAIGLRAIASAP